jgi:hypothetical protein
MSSHELLAPGPGEGVRADRAPCLRVQARLQRELAGPGCSRRAEVRALRQGDRRLLARVGRVRRAAFADLYFLIIAGSGMLCWAVAKLAGSA